MPFYEYECRQCGAQTEVMQKISDRPLKKCPECGKNALVKLISAPVFRLKGGGWYETDFKSDQDRKRNLADAPGGESAAKDADSRDAAKSDSGTKEAAGSKEAVAKESGSKDSAGNGSASKDSGGKEARGKPSSGASSTGTAATGRRKVATRKSSVSKTPARSASGRTTRKGARGSRAS